MAKVKTFGLRLVLPWVLVLAFSARAQIGGSGWRTQPVTFNVQSPYTLPQSDRYSFSNGVYHLWVYSNDPPFQSTSTTLPRTEQRFTPDYTNGEIQYQATMMTTTNVNAFCVFQIHTGDAEEDAYGSTTFMLFWYASDGGSVHDYDGTELANNLSGQWFTVNADHNMNTHVITIYINGREVWTQLDNNAGDFYFKDGVYMQNGASDYMENYITNNIQIWTNDLTGGNAQWSALPGAANTNWSTATNWTPAGAPNGQTSVTFEVSTAVTAGSPFSAVGNGGGGIVYPSRFNSFVDAGFGGQIGSLTYSNVNGAWQNTLLAGGHTLTITEAGGLTVGNGVSGVDYGSTATEFVTIAGSTLNLNNPSAALNVVLGSATNGSQTATLDLSGLGTLTANIGQLLAGVPGVNRPGATVYLAATNNITAGYSTTGTETSDTPGTGAIVVGDSSSNNGNACALFLGRVNNINADTILTARQKVSSARIQFNPNLTGAAPSANFTGYAGGPVQVWSIGDGVANGGTTTCAGVNDFSAGIVNAQVNTMYVGRASTSPNGAAPGAANASTGVLTIAAGTFNVNTLYAGLQSAAGVAKYGVGTINVNSNAALGQAGTLIVNNTLYLASTTAGAPSTAGSLNVTNGAVWANCIVAGGGVSTINLNGGALLLSNTAGAPGAPLSALNLAGGALQFLLNGAAVATNIAASSVTTSGKTAIAVASITNVSGMTVFPLLSYTGPDPCAGLTLATLPSGYGGALLDNTAASRIDLSVTYAVTNPPVVTNLSLSGATLRILGTNGPANGTYEVLSTTNLTPPANWQAIFSNTADALGRWAYTNTNTASSPARFYRVVVP
jgi:hypothetical protein